MLSQSAEYVLRVVVHLAKESGTALTTHQIAQATKVPEGYLSKLLQSLGRAGLVDSQRGLHGGFVLTRQPQDLTAFEVVQAVTPTQRITKCPLGLHEHHDGKMCALHRRLDQAMATMEQALRESTIADFVTNTTA